MLPTAVVQQFSLVMWTTSRRFDGEGRLVEVLLRVASGRARTFFGLSSCLPLRNALPLFRVGVSTLTNTFPGHAVIRVQLRAWGNLTDGQSAIA
jgi:hypothetical protein